MAKKKLGKDPFFERRRDWARYKHEILGKYLRGWFAKLATRSPVLAFVDTCAGEGIYADNEAGSPIIAARLNSSYAREHGQQLRVYACEANPDSASALEANLREFIEAGDALVFREEFGTALPRILDLTRDIPTLVFIDPYGMKDLRETNLKSLLEDTERESTELIMRVPPQLLARFAGQARKGDKRAESFRRLMAQLGISEEVISEAADAETGIDVNQEDLLAAFLEQIESRFEIVTLIPVRDDYYVAPKYYLVHGTRSEHGLVLMNDIVSKAEDNLYESTEAKRSGGQGTLFENPGRQPRVPFPNIEKLIIETTVSERSPTWLNLRAAAVRRFGMGEVREKHLRAAARGLIDDGIIDHKTSDGKPRKSIKDYDRFELGKNWKP